MKPLVTRALSRLFDERAVAQCGMSELELMENAGRAATDLLIREQWGGAHAGKRALVVCGTGNNGGDGFVVARQLIARGASAACFLVGSRAKLSKGARANLDAFVGVGGVVQDVEEGALLDDLRAGIEGVDVIVDALFGTGLNRALSGDAVGVIDMLNESSVAKVSLDLPSGLDSDTGNVLGACVNAALTITFGQMKLGLVSPKGAMQSGSVFLADIGVPETLVASPYALIEDSDLLAWLPPRSVDAHKFSVGHVAVIGGSEGKIGAPLMCGEAALRGGAGVVTLLTWERVAHHFESRVRELMVGRIQTDDLEASLDGLLEKKRAIVIGPGLGFDDDAERVVLHVLRTFTGTVVLDADALRAGDGNPEAFAQAEAAVILTPHAGEAARLLGIAAAEVDEDRISAALSLAKRSRSVVTLKGAFTVIATPSGEIRIAAKGSAALATAGSGDVLAGLVGAFATSLPPLDAASAAVQVHARVGEAWERTHDDRGMLAHEIAEGVPGWLGALRRSARLP